MFHVFIFHVLQNVLRLCTRLFPVLRSDWIEKHGSRRIFQGGCGIIQNEKKKTPKPLFCCAAVKSPGDTSVLGAGSLSRAL